MKIQGEPTSVKVLIDEIVECGIFFPFGYSEWGIWMHRPFPGLEVTHVIDDPDWPQMISMFSARTSIPPATFSNAIAKAMNLGEQLHLFPERDDPPYPYTELGNKRWCRFGEDEELFHHPEIWLGEKTEYITPDQFVEFWDQRKRVVLGEIGACSAKKVLTSIRRTEFNYNRADLQLQMIEAGKPYVCAFDGCMRAADLTIDHIIPISRGGTDDLGNLQFMCRPHNSSKGAKAS